jgi:cytochrome c-type biogenesis protein CcmH/NrfG
MPEASKELLTSLELLPRATTLYHLAVLYQKTGDPRKALEQATEALKQKDFPERAQAQALSEQLQKELAPAPQEPEPPQEPKPNP